MGLMDTKIQTPSTKPERMPRVQNREQYRQNYDEIFRKNKNTHKGEADEPKHK